MRLLAENENASGERLLKAIAAAVATAEEAKVVVAEAALVAVEASEATKMYLK